MSRAYHNRKTYRSKSGGNDAAFPVVILMACAVWAHKVFMLKVEHYALIFGIVCIILVALALLYKPFKSVRPWHCKPNHGAESIDNMTGLQFEKYVASVLKQRGFTSIQLTEQYDLGVDIIAHKNGIKWGIQVKRYSGLVKADAVRQVVTALKFYSCDKAMVITNSSFSRVAVELADSNDCLLIDRDKLTAWLQRP
jgi:HJR/Mrr/RecB family endonuclease